MSEEDARSQVTALVGYRATERLARLVTLVLAENGRQNLIARSTVDQIWSRHVLDSVQLLRLAGAGSSWLDIGTGGGFPGLAIAAADVRSMLLVEPRRRRAGFLADAAASLELDHVRVVPCKVEAVSMQAAIISARAVSPVQKLLQAARHCATPATRWLFLRGRPSVDELRDLRDGTGMMFHVEHSLSDPASSIVIAEAARS